VFFIFTLHRSPAETLRLYDMVDRGSIPNNSNDSYWRAYPLPINLRLRVPPTRSLLLPLHAWSPLERALSRHAIFWRENTRDEKCRLHSLFAVERTALDIVGPIYSKSSSRYPTVFYGCRSIEESNYFGPNGAHSDHSLLATYQESRTDSETTKQREIGGWARFGNV